jgi:hypothetical protein
MAAVNLRFTASPRIIHPAGANHRKDSCTRPRNRLPDIYREQEGITIAKQAHVRPTAPPAIHGERLDTAIAAFLVERDLAPSSHRVYALALSRLQDQLGVPTTSLRNPTLSVSRRSSRGRCGASLDSYLLTSLTSARRGFQPVCRAFRVS